MITIWQIIRETPHFLEQMKIQTNFQREKPLFRDRPEYKSIGYARQSTTNQISIGAQVEELKKAGCVVVFQETVSSANKDRPQFFLKVESKLCADLGLT